MKKTLLVLFFVLSLCNAHSQSGWFWQYPQYTGEQINCIYFFPASTTGWVGGNHGKLMKTTNDGTTWDMQNLITSLDINYIYFTDEQTGFIGCTGLSNGFTYRTTNSGVNWSIVCNYQMGSPFFLNGNTGWLPTGPNYILKTENGGYSWAFYEVNFNPSSVWFINSMTGYGCGKTGSGYIAKSTNGGINWQKIGPDFNNLNFSNIWFLNEFSGWISDNSGKLYKTTNGGTNWTESSLYLGNTISFRFFSMEKGLVYYSNNIYKTINSGINWTTMTNDSLGFKSAYFFKSIDTGYTSNNKAMFNRTYNSGNNWQVLCGENNNVLNDIKFTDLYYGYAVGHNGTILRTSNGGNNWIYYNSGNRTLNTVFFVENSTGWIGGDRILLKTTDGGNNWNTKVTPVNEIKCIYFINASTGWIVGDTTYKTTNGGLNWNLSAVSYYYDNIQFINSQTGFMSGGTWADGIRKTTNGGDNWIVLPDGGGTTKKGLYFVNELAGWGFFYTNNQTVLYKTTNGGNNWLEYSPVITGYSYYDVIKFIDSQNGFILCNNKFYRTTNGGINWIKFDIAAGAMFHTMDFVNSQTGWIAGDNNSIKKNTNGGVFVNQNGNEIPDKFSLFQNYPNPFNPTTNIKYQIPKNSLVTLKVYDVLGREVETLVNELQQAGVYETQFPGSTNVSLASGIYFYKLSAGDFIAVKRMVIIK